VLAAAAPADARDGGVKVTINGGPGRYLSYDTVAAALDQPQIDTTRRINGHDDQISVSGTKAATLVQLAGVGLPALVGTSAMTVTSELFNSTPVVLSASEVTDGLSGDPLGLRYATFGTNSGREVSFFEPLRSSDDPATHSLDSPTGSDLSVNLATRGHPLAVKITPSSTQIDPGGQVSFSASVDPAPDGSDTTYEWDYEGNDDPVTTTGPGGAHVYAANGLYAATLTVTTRDGSSGSDSADIQVGPPATNPPGAPPPPPGSTPGPGSGAPHPGAGTAGPKAPTHGPAKGPKTTSSTGHSKPSSGKGHTKTTPKRSTPKKTTPAATPAPESTPTTSGAARTSTSKQRGPTHTGADRNRKAKPTPDPAPHARGIPISGLLLAGTSAFDSVLPTLKPAAANALARTAARAAAGSPTSALGWLGGFGLCAGVLLSGVLTETRSLVRRTSRVA
jgi:hypothetical protein